MTLRPVLYALCAAVFPLVGTPALAGPDEDRRMVAALDTAFQAATERNDPDAIAKILHEDYILVVGGGQVVTGQQLIDRARTKEIVYERQVEEPGTQTVRLYGRDTAIVTALLWIKGSRRGQAIDRWLWFSDTYIRTPTGWRYAFGQASGDVPPPNPSRLK
jgi:ketosteroid isomerase-like protein